MPRKYFISANVHQDLFVLKRSVVKQLSENEHKKMFGEKDSGQPIFPVAEPSAEHCVDIDIGPLLLTGILALHTGWSQ